MDLRVPFSLIGPRKFPAADLTAEGLLAGVRANVRGQVVASREGTHADAALKYNTLKAMKGNSFAYATNGIDPYLEWLLPGVNSDVPRELVGPAEPSVALVNRALVGPLLQRRLRRTLHHFPHVRHAVDDRLVGAGSGRRRREWLTTEGRRSVAAIT